MQGRVSHRPCGDQPFEQPLLRLSRLSRDASGRPAPYVTLDQIEDGPADTFGPARVPPGMSSSWVTIVTTASTAASRRSDGGVGMLPVDDLIGRAPTTFWSTDGSASYLKPWTWFTALRVDRIGNGYSGSAKVKADVARFVREKLGTRRKISDCSSLR